MKSLVDETTESHTQNGSNSSRYEIGMQKRKSILRKTIAVERPTIEDINVDDKNEQSVEKNTNRSMYYANTLYKSLCSLCNKKDLRLVSHHLKHHPNHEVPIARPSPIFADRLRAQSQPFDLYKNKISGVCFFCEEIKTSYKSQWSTHILTHTGESQHFCTGCDTYFKQKCAHSKCKPQQFVSIYELNGSSGALEGYMCKDCNYLQIGKSQLEKHLSSQHNYNLSEMDEHYEKVTLIPDLSHVKANIADDFIEPGTLFNCTICNTQSANFGQFEEHFMENHSEIRKYICCCKKQLTFKFANYLTVLAHMFNHYADLYQCLSCKNNDSNIYHLESSILNHMSKDHAKDQWKFQHIYRQTDEQPIVTNITYVKFICNVCDQEFDQSGESVNHFKANHPEQITDIRTFVSKKSSHMTDRLSETRTKFLASENDYILRQSFLCTICHYESTCKEDLLAHYNELHRTESFPTMFEMKLGTTMPWHMESNMSNNINEKFDRFMAFSCYQCYENNNDTSVICGRVEDVHDHWLEQHRNTAHPFRFYIETLVQCNYCNIISTYKGMIEHTNDYHPKKPICFVNVSVYNQCPLCDYSCNPSKLPAHFESEHSTLLQVNMFNPNRLTDEQVQCLLKIDIHKKSMCDYCGEIFDVDELYNVHHELKHPNETKCVRNITDTSCNGLISSCCNQFISPSNFYNHLSTHSFEFTCKQCNIKICNLHEAAQHDSIKHNLKNPMEIRRKMVTETLRKMYFRTKVFYGNGVVLYKQNLCGTQYDDLEIFEQFLHTKEEHPTNIFYANQ